MMTLVFSILLWGLMVSNTKKHDLKSIEIQIKEESCLQKEVEEIENKNNPSQISEGPKDIKNLKNPEPKPTIDQIRLNQIKKTCDKMKLEKSQFGYTELQDFYKATNQAFNYDEKLEDRWSFNEFLYVPIKDQKSVKFSESSTNKNELQKFLIPNKHLFCIPPKSGTTNWRRALMKIQLQKNQALKNYRCSNKKTRSKSKKKTKGCPENFKYQNPEDIVLPEHEMSAEGMKFFHELRSLAWNPEFSQRDEMIFDQERLKILNVRHPVERLYSAWKQKFSKKHWSVGYFSKRFIKGSKPPIPHAKQTKTHVVGFDQFVDYFLRTWELNPALRGASSKRLQKSHDLLIDYHWHSMILQCYPCQIDYDFVSKLETAHEDSKRIFKKVFNRTDIVIPEAYKTHTSGVEAANAWLSEWQKDKLRTRFKWELEMFGYEY